jgi:hypothetical protein
MSYELPSTSYTKKRVKKEPAQKTQTYPFYNEYFTAAFTFSPTISLYIRRLCTQRWVGYPLTPLGYIDI